MRRTLLAALAALAAIAFATNLSAQGALDGKTIARNIAERPNADPRKGRITFLIENDGRTRTRAAKMLRTQTKSTDRLLLAFDKPGSIRGTSFLSYDHKAADRADETWLYLPATSRTRRVPSSDRADSFMGTELSYGDVKDSFKFGLADYDFTAGGRTKSGRLILKGEAKNTQIAREIGYGGFTAYIDADTWFPRVITFTDPAGRRLKTIAVRGIEKVGSSLTATDFTVTNHRSGRSTRVTVSGLSRANARESLFDPARLDRVAGRMP
ncbi:MAG: outer membrane lipoprotein-sorting protein [Erythrobacter sp.]|uniref:outer membrane lipoprotein-sorting protein n=1 Tax=Erythrobacter sp. TaxID=1042 RepID=UPI0032EE5B5D